MSETLKPQAPLSPEITRLAKKLEEDPRSKVFIPLAEEYMKAGYYEEAVAVLEEGVNSYPNFVTALVALGRAYAHLKETAKAQKVLKEVIRQSPENLLAHRMLAKLYLQEGNLSEASRSCEKVLAANPKDEDTLALKAKITQQGSAPGTPAAPQSAKAGEATATGSGRPPGQKFRFRAGEEDESASAEVQPAKPEGRQPKQSDKVARLQRLMETIRQRRGTIDDPA